MNDQPNNSKIDPIDTGLASQKYSAYHLLKNFNTGFLEINTEYEAKYCSPELAQLLSLSQSEVLNENLWAIIKKYKFLNWLVEHKDGISPIEKTKFEKFIGEINFWIEITFIPNKAGFSVYINNVNSYHLISEEIKLTKDKFIRLFESNPIPQWIYDTKTLKFLNVNSAAIKKYGYSREEFLKLTIRDIRSKTELKSLNNILKYNVKVGLLNSSIVVHQLKNGENRYVRVESSPIIFDGVDSRLVLALDCTDQHLAKEELAKSEHRYKSLVQNGSDMVSILDYSWNYMYTNQTIKTVLDIDPSELSGRNAFDFIHEDDKEMLMVQLANLKDKKQIRLTPFRFPDGNKNYRWIETVLTDMTDEVSIGGVIGNSRDVTELIESKIELQNSIDRYEIVSKATSDAIWDLDILTGKISWNKGIKGIFGHKSMEYSLDWFRNHVHPEDLEKNFVQKYNDTINKGKSRLTRQYRFKCADGTYKTVLDRCFIIFDSLKNPIRIIGSMQDITLKIDYINAIEKQNKKLQEISWLQSHAVRAPLARILGLTQLITEPKIIDNNDCSQIIAHISSSAEELDAVIANIIKTAR